MKNKIINKIAFLEKVLEELEKDYEKEECLDTRLLQMYAEEELIYKSQIKVLKQILNEL